MDKRKNIVAIALAVLIFIPMASFAAERPGQPAKPTAVLGDASSVLAKVSSSVVIVEAEFSGAKLQGSGVAFANGAKDFKLSNTFIVCSAHVVKNARAVSVSQGGKRYEAVADYVDDDFDLAILYVDGVALPVIKPYSGPQLEVGDKVFAVGSPLPPENTVTEGVVTAKHERNGVLLLQTTVPILRGSSGGGLFDVLARLVGITASKPVSGGNFAVDAAFLTECHYATAHSDILRFVAKDNFSHNEMVIINSFALTKWLLTARAENGKKFNTEVEHLMSEAALKPSGALEQLPNQLVQIVRRFLSDQAGQDRQRAQVSSEPVQLICTVANANGRNPQDFPLKLDYTNKTANGSPADITDAEIRWEGGKDMKLSFVLNRYSGSIRIGHKGSPVITSGTCSRTGERKF